MERSTRCVRCNGTIVYPFKNVEVIFARICETCHTAKMVSSASIIVRGDTTLVRGANITPTQVCEHEGVEDSVYIDNCKNCWEDPHNPSYVEYFMRCHKCGCKY